MKSFCLSHEDARNQWRPRKSRTKRANRAPNSQKLTKLTINLGIRLVNGSQETNVIAWQTRTEVTETTHTQLSHWPRKNSERSEVLQIMPLAAAALWLEKLGGAGSCNFLTEEILSAQKLISRSCPQILTKWGIFSPNFVFWTKFSDSIKFASPAMKPLAKTVHVWRWWWTNQL